MLFENSRQDERCGKQQDADCEECRSLLALLLEAL
jgi:hypothetical protein